MRELGHGMNPGRVEQEAGGLRGLIHAVVGKLGTRNAMAVDQERVNERFDTYLLDAQERINGQLHDFVGETHEKFRAPYEHSLLCEAKRLRPVLAYITADTFGIPRERLDKFSVASELVHTASLIFDDLPAQDDADLRRGRPTLHKEFGESTAQMISLSMIFDHQKNIAQTDAENNLGGRLAEYCSDALGQRGLCQGQLRDLQTVGMSATSLENLDEIAYLKTGIAIEMSIIGAAIIGGLDDETTSALRGYAYHAGIAFQVKDDLLDVEGGNTGKQAGIDERNSKPTYISTIGVEGSQEKLAYHLEEAGKALALIPGANTRKYQEILGYIQGRRK